MASTGSVKPSFSGSATHPRLEQSIVDPVRHGDVVRPNGNSWLSTVISHSYWLARLSPGQISLPGASLPPREQYDASQPTYKPATHASSRCEAAPRQHERLTCEEFIHSIDFEARKLFVYVEFYNGAARAQLKVQHTRKSSLEKTLVDIDNIKRSLERIQDIIRITERACKETTTEDTYRENLSSWHEGH
ncbi:sexual development transcription factor NsdD [Akanthomyces lecanii RCEF 1005]|uniref:Sexual development transcription factor NsdD n=1 Tax=Akanthomyces lecanii RCEF 1005 TaxID=1081108 RepID=A0A167TS28_CORDF|nr:sexual development transcription factor NsdD [Akanthomyces lecanii RCEF 1005]